MYLKHKHYQKEKEEELNFFFSSIIQYPSFYIQCENI